MKNSLMFISNLTLREIFYAMYGVIKLRVKRNELIK